MEMNMNFLNGWTINVNQLPDYEEFTKRFTVPIDKKICDLLISDDNKKITNITKNSFINNVYNYIQNDTLTITHSNRYGLGRFYSDGDKSPCCHTKLIKHTIFSYGNWVDIDMVKGHPSILLYLCKRNNYKNCNAISRVVNDWDNVVKEIHNHYLEDGVDLNEDNIKYYFNLTIYGGSYDRWVKELKDEDKCKDYGYEIKIIPDTAYISGFMVDFKNEIDKIIALVYSGNPDIEKLVCEGKQDYQKANTVMSYFCGTIENHLIYYLYRWLIGKKYINPFNCLLEYDGLCLPVVNGNLDYIIEQVNNIFGYHFDIKFKFKLYGKFVLFNIIQMRQQQDFPISDKVEEIIEIENDNLSISNITETTIETEIVLKQQLKEINEKKKQLEKQKKQQEKQIEKQKLKEEKQQEKQKLKEEKQKEKLKKKQEEDDLFNKLAIEFEKDHAKIINKSVYVKETNNEIIVMSKEKLVSSYEHIECGLNADGFPILFINKWIKFNDGIRKYDDMGIYPKEELCPKNIFNMWRPFAMELFTDEYMPNKEGMDFILNHIKILCNNEIEVYDYIIKWIAQSILYPETKTIIPTFTGKQGDGKSTLIKFLGKIYGSNRVLDTTDPNRDVWGNFNSLMVNAYLVNLNELSKNDTKDCEGKIKGLITDGRLYINTKGINQYAINSYHRFMGTTNVLDPMKTEKDDRRNLIIRCSDEKKGDKEYFEKLHGYIDDINIIRTCYDYFKTIPNMDKFNTIPIPKTEYQNNLKELYKTPVESWLEDFTIKNVDNKENIIEKLGSETFMDFEEWKINNNITYETTPTKLGVALINMDTNKGITKGRHTKKGDTKYFNIPILKKYFNIGCLINLDDERKQK